MATYVLPQVQVFQELNTAPQAGATQQPALIAGPHAYLARYAVPEEKATAALGYYDPASDTCSAWPALPVGGIIDPDYTAVFIDDALLLYFENDIGGADTIDTIAGQVNQIAADTTVWKSSGESYPRAAALLDRDVQLGDVVRVVAVISDVVYTLWTYVQGFVANVVPAVVGAATADSGNFVNQGASTSYTQPVGPWNCVKIQSVDGTTYDGLADGDITETYTVRVLQSSADGYAPAALLQVVSASGNDDANNVVPAIFGEPTHIGARGLTVTWSDSAGECSVSSSVNDVPDADFVVGQTYTITVKQAFTAPTATKHGAYGGAQNLTYIITVTKGGKYINAPQITVTTDIGTDYSGPTAITAANTNFPLGTQGVAISFNQTALLAGDKYYIPVTAATEGAYQTLVLGHNLPAAVIANGVTSVGVTLYIKKNIQVAQDRVGFAPTLNWSQTGENICLNSDIVAYDSTWTDDGVQLALPVVSAEAASFGTAYVQYRAWLPDLSENVSNIFDISTLSQQVSGPIVPDNPLAFALSLALANNNGVPVSFIGVSDPTNLADWETVLELIDGRRDCYGLVPLSDDPAVQNLFVAHVNGESTPAIGAWRELWLSLPPISELALLSAANSSDEGVVLATISADPASDPTAYTILNLTSGNGQFLVDGVAPGDVVRYFFSTDGFGNVTYDEYVVNAVYNQHSLQLVTGPNAAEGTPQKVEVWRNLDQDQQAAALGQQNTFSNRRIMLVYGDHISAAGYSDLDGTFLCAALAALASGVVPQQALTNIEISGFQKVTTPRFTRSQLDTLAGNGVWIVTQNINSGAIYTRDALTTGPYSDINQRSECITRNLDNVAFYELDWFSPYIGVSNVTDALLTTLQAEFTALRTSLMTRNFVTRLGPQVIDIELAEPPRADLVLQDHVLMVQNVTLPYALDVLQAYLVL